MKLTLFSSVFLLFLFISCNENNIAPSSPEQSSLQKVPNCTPRLSIRIAVADVRWQNHNEYVFDINASVTFTGSTCMMLDLEDGMGVTFDQYLAWSDDGYRVWGPFPSSSFNILGGDAHHGTYVKVYIVAHYNGYSATSNTVTVAPLITP